ncbi:MAG TPA: 3-hydroxybutyryl-CoA dehydrogenase [Porphyromonadaceae bacterium]|nr:3-hydroxybutyryl-CoA dehydrogenase [Petrimonas sp.]BBD44148.1 3-hydroxybutyryl-CoA dehydrogenase [Petrimonas sp. IBARAKI]HBF95917.1 3-hydroxybutyryl-CoA dehydrogenase [Porphyromonadaceae bacterium]HCA98656.1 3-hydroxybutyryl-CoA dehydrogenase [Porphyromonadaceae bacterium]HCB87877.1 3-hydroxybutyryl-CoA dehydrogenase [Porphyromonadaceae bacterium]
MKIGVIGTGTMGNGIAQAFAQGGYPVVMKDLSDELLQKAVENIDNSLSRLVAKEKLNEADKQQILARIATTLSYEDFNDCGLIVEAIAENIELKKKVFRELDETCPPGTILATNSSSLSITEIAACTRRPEKVIGMHFFNPVPVLKLVEVIRGQLTADSVFDSVSGIAKNIGKVPVTVNEAPGFLVNRLLIPMINEGIGALAEGVASKEEIDEAMKLGAGHPIGPLALADLIGLDVCLAILEVLHHEFGDDKYRPHPLLRKMVRANLLGRKTGTGFYDYQK